MKNVQEIRADIEKLYKEIDLLEEKIISIQSNCNHEFKGDTYYQTCVLCKKVRPLYF
ncbi:hypothetical protein [Evansella cellulosilytica]|uniref:Serine protease n=1 Tax=Evansella cellulosilytica (strain ATCC 21833 / DSM 2522 / FERM P-1141 / JCM 9156 / N-4) TaxID=649639 RepID=E6TSD6_EVAC2|nr:hypothetical protein [Evansella cellulosilytica]ADU31905.1 hypothetical protein Bcell_3664 [Evansella cellulosilytica DSM 2522]